MGDVNLIPPERLARRQSRARFRLLAWLCIVYITGLVVAVASAYAFWTDRDGQLEYDLATAAKRLQQNDEQILQMRKELAQATAALQTGRMIASQPDWSKLLTLVSQNLGDQVVLTTCRLLALDPNHKNLIEGLSQQAVSVSLTGLLVESQHQLCLGGFGRTQTAVSEFILRLEQAGLFKSVRRVHSSRQEFLGADAIAFSIECDF